MDIVLLWIPATVLAAAAQTARNSMQRRLTATLGTLGATQVRFLYGLPFALLFLLVILLAEGSGLPKGNASFTGFLAAAALIQIAATALMLAAMQLRSFAVTTVYVKTEPVQVAVFAWAVLGDTVSFLGLIAVIVATLGVIVMSWRRGLGDAMPWRAVALGLASGACFALSSVAFRGAILALDDGSFVLCASYTLVNGLILQTVVLVSYMAWRQRPALVVCLRAWRESLLAGFMGAFASQCWFIGFALTSAVNVRTLGLVEVLFAQAVSHRVFGEHANKRERLGMALVMLGVVALLWQQT